MAKSRSSKQPAAARGWIFWFALFAIAAAGFTAIIVAVARRSSSPVVVPQGVETFDIRARSHTQGRVQYPQTPPVGGDHAPVWQNCGFYDAPIPDETAVHSLEHGAVWITYRSDLPPAQVETLRRLAGRRTFILVSPFPGLLSAVVASAWVVQLRAESTDDPRIVEFVRAFRIGPQTPEPGASCTGGSGDLSR